MEGDDAASGDSDIVEPSAETLQDFVKFVTNSVSITKFNSTYQSEPLIYTLLTQTRQILMKPFETAHYQLQKFKGLRLKLNKTEPCWLVSYDEVIQAFLKGSLNFWFTLEEVDFCCSKHKYSKPSLARKCRRFVMSVLKLVVGSEYSSITF